MKINKIKNINKPKRKARYCKDCKTELHWNTIASKCPKCQLKRIKFRKEKHKKTKAYRETESRKLIKTLDNLISQYVKLRDKNKCFTPTKDCKGYMQCGHLISRRNKSTRFDLINCNCQCSRHNYLHNTKPEIYTRAWIKKYGEIAYGMLVDKSEKIKQWTVQELLNEIKKIKSLYEKLKNI